MCLMVILPIRWVAIQWMAKKRIDSRSLLFLTLSLIMALVVTLAPSDPSGKTLELRLSENQLYLPYLSDTFSPLKQALPR